jgi:hypothetical protein
VTLKPTYELVLNGLKQQAAQHAELELTKRGALRAGNTGLITPDGEVAGKCARQTLLRLRGIDAEAVNHSRELMFGAGRGNEPLWIDNLVAGGIERDRIRCEEEVPIRWSLPSGRLVTGRPDLVIGNWEHHKPESGESEWVPERGLELKLVSSLWTGRDVALKREPKLIHLLQAGHYAWKLDIPFEVWYTSRADFHLPPDTRWGEDKKWPRPGRPGSEFIGMNESGQPLKLIPFVVGFELGWFSGELRYRHLSPSGPGVWVSSIVTQAGIQAYFETVDAMDRAGQLAPRPTSLTATGEKGSYNLCSYCPLNDLCKGWQGDAIDPWVEAAAAYIKTLSPTGSIR